MAGPEHTSGSRTDTLAALGEPLARGRTADVYAWTPGLVLKLFQPWVGRGAIEYEARLARAVRAAGLAVPGVGALVEIERRRGIEYERVEGGAMDREMAARPWRLVTLANLLARLHAEVHRVRNVAGIPSQREQLRAKITAAPALSASLRQAALAVLADLPDGDRLCHGDFHPGNVLLSDRGAVIIDWIDATVGNPLADVARTIIISSAPLPPGAPWALRLGRVAALRAYLRRYFALRPGGRAEYQRWLPVVAAARLEEGISDLEPWLLAQVEHGLHRLR